MQLLTDRYGVLDSPLINTYFPYLKGRLYGALENHQGSKDNCSIMVLNTNTPIAVSPGPHWILISRGMLLKLSVEAELAFVIAHEIGHHYYRHALADGAGTDFTHNMELEADRFALGLIALAGYDIRLATSALTHAYSSDSHTSASSHPALASRTQAIEAQIRKSSWSPPGSQDRRSFQELRRQLIQR